MKYSKIGLGDGYLGLISTMGLFSVDQRWGNDEELTTRTYPSPIWDEFSCDI